MRILVLGVLALSVSACTVPPPPLPSVFKSDGWVSYSATDPMTDVTRCVVAWGRLENVNNKPALFGLPGRLYPFAAKLTAKSGERVLVGVSVHPAYGVMPPVGDIELRIDGQTAITIAAAETPIKATPSQALLANQAAGMNNMAGAKPEDVEAYKKAMAGVGASLAAMTAPQVATTGAKADTILAQMKTGRTIIYRQALAGREADLSTIPLEGFAQEAAKCGI